MISVIDTHQHLWDLCQLDLAWHREEPYTQLARDYLPDDYRAEATAMKVVKTIYMEVDVAPEQHALEAEFALELCRRDDNDLAGAVIGGRPATTEFEGYIRQYGDNPYVKGLRQLLFDLPTEYCLQADFVRDIRLLGDLGLSFDIETPATGLEAAAALVDRCPETRFIIDHYGNPNLRDLDDDNWRTAMAELARRDNVAVKLSGVTTALERGAWRSVDIAPATDHLLEVFGSERALYGSDWPVVKINSSLQGWYEAMVAMVGAYSEAEQRRIFCDNAVVWYGL